MAAGILGDLFSLQSLVLLLILVAAGLAAGVLAGLLGIGGGGVLVPVLYEVFTALNVPDDVRMHVTLGTSLAIIVPTSLRSFAGHKARGSVDFEVWTRVAGWVVLGVLVGVLLARVANADALKWVWIVFASLVALKLVFAPQAWRLADDLPASPWPQATFSLFGTLSTLMSIGGGTFVVPYLTLYGRQMLQAVGTAAAIGPLIAVPGVMGYIWAGWGNSSLPDFTVGYVHWAAALVVAPLSVAATQVGVRFAHSIERRTLELCFAAFLATVAVRFLISVMS
jgi:uncharacterized protein